MKICSKCNKTLSDDLNFCTECGGEAVVYNVNANINVNEGTNKICGKCGAKNSVSNRFCNKCGNEFV